MLQSVCPIVQLLQRLAAVGRHDVAIDSSSYCATLVDAQGLHAMVCKKAPGKVARHHVFNDIIWRAVGAAGIPAVKERSGLDRQVLSDSFEFIGTI